MTETKSRGGPDIFVACVTELEGFPEAIEETDSGWQGLRRNGTPANHSSRSRGGKIGRGWAQGSYPPWGILPEGKCFSKFHHLRRADSVAVRLPYRSEKAMSGRADSLLGQPPLRGLPPSYFSCGSTPRVSAI